MNSSFVTESDSLYFGPNSDSDFDSDTENIHPSKKGRKKGKAWITINKNFSSLDDAKSHIKAEKKWKYRYRTKTLNDQKIYYACKFSKYCSAQLYILLK